MKLEDEEGRTRIHMACLGSKHCATPLQKTPGQTTLTAPAFHSHKGLYFSHTNDSYSINSQTTKLFPVSGDFLDCRPFASP